MTERSRTIKLPIRFGAIAAAVTLLATCVRPTTAPTPDVDEMQRAIVIAANTGVMPDGVVVMRFFPPPIYDTWRAEVEECSGLTRPPTEGVTYWVAQTVLISQRRALGFYVRETRKIVLSLGSETLAWVVRHEILHDLVNADPSTEAHPALYFRERCGALVWGPPTPTARGGSS